MTSSKSFLQTTSLLQRLRRFVLVFAAFFLIEVLGFFVFSHSFVEGLNSVRKMNQLYGLTTKILLNIDSCSHISRELLDPISRYSADKIYPVVQKQLSSSIDKALLLSSEVDLGDTKEIHRLFDSTAALAREMELHGSRILDHTGDPRSSADLLALSQLYLEARENVNRVQIQILHESDVAFQNVYEMRYRPVFFALLLAAIFFGFTMVMGLRFVRGLGDSIASLLKATDLVAQGHFETHAEILSSDEIGKLAFSFNEMIESISENRTHLEFLSNMGSTLAKTLNYEETLRSATVLGIPLLADWCVLDIVEEDGRCKRTAAHRDPRLRDLVERYETEYPGSVQSPHGLGYVLRNKRTEVEEVAQYTVADQHRADGHSDVLNHLGVASYVSVPLDSGRSIIGCLTFISSTPRKYLPAEIKLAEAVGYRAAMMIENARLYQNATDAIHIRDEFLSIASHELKTPLTSMSLQLNMIIRALNRSPEQVKASEISSPIQKSIKQLNRLTSLINELLDVSRIQAGKLTLDMETVNLSELVVGVVEKFQAELTQTGTLVELELDSRIEGSWDPLRVEQVLVNFLSNAIKYAPGKPVKILVTESERQALIQVADQGPGIPSEKQKIIFERFERATDSRISGLGLGLYISKQIAEAHSGTIEVENKIEGGSVFTLKLPIAENLKVLSAEL